MTSLAKALAELPAAFDMLPLFLLPGYRPDMGSPQRHGSDSTRSLVTLAVLDLLDRRNKPDADPSRGDYELDRAQWQWKDDAGRLITEPGRRRQGVLPTLSSWVRRVDGELWDGGVEHAAPDEDPTVAGECDWLQSHIAWIGEQQWLDEITRDVTGMLRDIREIVGEDDKLEGKLFCLNAGCGWPVVEHSEGAWFSCTGCGGAWSRLELHRRAERKKPKPLVECAKLAGVSEKTLRRYKDDGKLKVERRQGKTELFDLEEVMEITMHFRYRQTTVA
jgi:hypothetical protein